MKWTFSFLRPSLNPLQACWEHIHMVTDPWKDNPDDKMFLPTSNCKKEWNFQSCYVILLLYIYMLTKCLQPTFKSSNPFISSWLRQKSQTLMFSSILEGVTDLAARVPPICKCQRITILAGDFSYLLASWIIMGCWRTSYPVTGVPEVICK